MTEDWGLEVALDRLVRLADRGVLSTQELADEVADAVAEAADRAVGPARLQPGARPDLVHSQVVWAAAEDLVRARRAALDTVRPGTADAVLRRLDDARRWIFRWWHLHGRLAVLRQLVTEGPPGPELSSTVTRDVVDLVRQGIDGVPLDDRQLQELAELATSCGLADALVAGAPDVPLLGAGHGLLAWANGCGSVDAVALKDALISLAGTRLLTLTLRDLRAASAEQVVVAAADPAAAARRWQARRDDVRP